MASRRALGNDDRAEQFRLSHHIAEDTHHEVEFIADIDRGQPLDPTDAQAARGIGAEDRDALGADRMPAVRETVPRRGRRARRGADPARPRAPPA